MQHRLYQYRPRSDAELEEEVRRIYGCYANVTKSGLVEDDVDRNGFKRFCKECHLLDNRFTLTHVDLMFTTIAKRHLKAEAAKCEAVYEEAKARGLGKYDPVMKRAAAEHEAAQALLQSGTGASDPLMLKFDAFRSTIAEMADVKFPGQPPQRQFRLIVEAHLVPFISDNLNKLDAAQEAMSDPKVMKVVHQYEGGLKVGRCKGSDPGLKAPLVSKSQPTEEKLAFKFNLGSDEVAPLHQEDLRGLLPVGHGGDTRQRNVVGGD